MTSLMSQLYLAASRNIEYIYVIRMFEVVGKDSGIW